MCKLLLLLQTSGLNLIKPEPLQAYLLKQKCVYFHYMGSDEIMFETLLRINELCQKKKIIYYHPFKFPLC